jgi:hypothetical protein
MNCKVPWCLALCAPETDACVIHRQHPKFTPLPEQFQEALWVFEIDDGECDVCWGSGQHTCDDDRCNAEHDCGACDGTGETVVITATNQVSREIHEYREEEFEAKFPGVSLDDIKNAPKVEQAARRYEIDTDLYKELR